MSTYETRLEDMGSINLLEVALELLREESADRAVEDYQRRRIFAEELRYKEAEIEKLISEREVLRYWTIRAALLSLGLWLGPTSVPWARTEEA